MTALKSYSVQTPARRQVGTAVENRDGTISLRLHELPVPFTGTLLLRLDAAALHVRPPAPSSPPRPPAPFVEATREGLKTMGRARELAQLVGSAEHWHDPFGPLPKREVIACPCRGRLPGHMTSIVEAGKRCSVVVGPPVADPIPKPLGAYVAIACDCNGSKPGHEPLGDLKGKSRTCAVLNDGRNHG